MPYDDPDATDPMTLHAIEVETDDPGSVRAMAECFAEEYVRMGLSADSILELFRDGKYAGPSLALNQLGMDTIKAIIREQIAIRGPRATRTFVDQTPGGIFELPVFDW